MQFKLVCFFVKIKWCGWMEAKSVLRNTLKQLPVQGFVGEELPDDAFRIRSILTDVTFFVVESFVDNFSDSVE